MKVSERTITAIAKIVTGDNQKGPYRSGSKLVRLFNELGYNDVYGKGFPSRISYTEERVRDLNRTGGLPNLFEMILDPRDYIETEDLRGEMVDYLNDYLRYDGYELVRTGENFKVRDMNGASIDFYPSVARVSDRDEISYAFIEEQVQKGERKLLEGDYDGAITNARSLIEAILLEIDKSLDGGTPKNDGDLIKLYKRVQGKLNLDPGAADMTTPIRQILSGLASIVHGLAGVRNEMSDAHARTYKPSKHHARLAVNAAKTLADFMFGTLEFQREKRTVKQ